jgi:hypothetical protein
MTCWGIADGWNFSLRGCQRGTAIHMAGFRFAGIGKELVSKGEYDAGEP